MPIVRYRNVILSLLALLVIAAFVIIGTLGLKQSIDFTGGSEIELSYASSTRPTAASITEKLVPLSLGTPIVQQVGDKALIIRTRALTEAEHIDALSVLGAAPANEMIKEESYSSIGPSIGAELKRKAGWGIALVILLIILYVAFAFRKVGRIVPGWLYGIITIITLVHDIAIPAGVFALLGYFYHVQIDALFVTALLAILGYSINDTIVVLDRVRENLNHASPKEQENSFPEIVGKSLGQTYVRSINTSVTVLLVLLALLFVGSEATHYFALTLAIGVLAGTYSSILLASPLLVVLQGLRKRRK